MTTPIGQALGLNGVRPSSSGFASQERSAGPRDFEREFEQALVDTWFQAGPVARREPAPTRDGDPSGRAAPTDPLRSSQAPAGSAGRAPEHGRDAERPATPGRRTAMAVRADPIPSEGSATATGPLQAAIGPGSTDGARRLAGTAVAASEAPTRTTPLLAARPALPPVAFGATPVAPRLPDAPHPPFTAVEEALAHRPAARDAAPTAPPPPIRLHVEADAPGTAARVWLGVDVAGRAASSAVVGHVRDALARSGVRLASVVVNGTVVDGTAPPLPLHPRQDP